MSFTQAIKTVLSKYATFSGRAERPEYWWWTLFVFVLTICTSLVDHNVLAPRFGFEAYNENTPEILTLIVSLALLVPGLAVSVRRLHDVDQSGWRLLFILIPLIGFLILLYWFVQRGTDGPNRFGPGRPHDAVL